MIERVSGKSLDEYFKANIFRPLGMGSVTFHPSEEAKANMAYMHRRSADEKLATTDHFYRRPLLAYGEGNKAPCAGGHGCFGKPAEFGSKFYPLFLLPILTTLGLISLLLNDGIDKVTGVRLLKPETVQGACTCFWHSKLFPLTPHPQLQTCSRIRLPINHVTVTSVFR